MKWEVGILGDETDLRMLAEAFVGPEAAIVKRGRGYFIASTAFDSLTEPETARDKAREIVAVISGASKLLLGSSRSIAVPGSVVRVGDNGDRPQTILPDPAAIALRVPHVTRAVSGANGAVERHLPAGQVVEDCRRATQSEAVRKVLRLRGGRELQWTDLTRLLEVIQNDGGPVNASDEELRRLTGSANHPDVAGDLARHGAPNWDPPPEHKRMKLHEARDLIDLIIRYWLASREPASDRSQSQALGRSTAAPR